MRTICTGLLLLIFCGLLAQERPELLVQSGHKDAVSCLDISGDDKFMATGGRDGLIKFWDLKTGREFKTLNLYHGSIASVDFVNKQSGILSVNEKGRECRITMHEFPSGKKIWEAKEKTNLVSFHMNVDQSHGRIIYYASSYLVILDMNGETLLRKKVKIHRPKMLGLSKDGSKILALTRGRGCVVLDKTSAAILDTIPTPKTAKTMVISNDGKSILVNETKFRFSRFAIQSGKQIATYNIPNPDDLTEKFYSGDYAAPLTDDKIAINHHGYVLIQDPNEQKTTSYIPFNIQGNVLRTKASSGGSVNAFRVSPSGKRLALSIYTDLRHIVRIVDLPSRKVMHDIVPSHSPIYKLQFNPYNDKMYIGGKGYIKMWESGNFGGATMLDNYIMEIRGMGFHPQDSFIFAQERDNSRWITRVSDNETKMFKFWVNRKYQHAHDLRSGKAVMDSSFKRVYTGKVLRNYPQGDTLCVFGKAHALGNFLSPDEKYCVIVHWNTGNLKVRLHSAEDCSLKKEYVYPNKGFNVTGTNKLQVAFSPDGKYMALGRDEIHIYDLQAEKFEPVRKLNGHHRIGYRERFIGEMLFTKDSKKLISAGMDRMVRVWNVETGKQEKVLAGHTDEVNTLVYHPNGKFILSGGADSRIIYWDAGTLEEVASMVFFGATDYIIYTPDNYYMATKEAVDRVAFYYKKRILPFQQFDLRLNRPDIVMERLALGNVFERKMLNLAWQKRAKKAGFNPNDLQAVDFHTPEINVPRNGIPTSTNKEFLPLTITASDDKYALSKVQVLVNGVPVQHPAFDYKGKDTRKIKVSTKIELSQGNNHIRVSVFNEKGVESIQEELFVVADKPNFTKPTLWVVNVGVSKYKDEQWNLTFADKDAIELGLVFGEKLKGVKDVKVIPITNGDAKNTSVLGTIENLKTSVDDKVIITFSGHGLLDDKLDYYLAMYEVDFYSPSNGGLKYEDLQASLGKIKARNKVLFLDACHSGEVDKDEVVPAADHKSDEKLSAARSGPVNPKPQAGLTNAFSYMQALFSDVSAGTGTTVISAAGGYEFAYESKNWRNGLFTYSVLDGIIHNSRDRDDTHADVNKDQWISINELLDYVCNKVYGLSKGKQIPNARSFNRDNDFLLFPLY